MPEEITTQKEGTDAAVTTTKPRRSRRSTKPKAAATTKKSEPKAQQFEHKYPITKGPKCAVCGAPLSSAITKGELACPYGHPQPETQED